MELSRKNLSVGELISLKNKAGLEVSFTSFGAAIRDILFEGQFMTAHPKGDENFLHAPDFFGKIVGPMAGRVDKGRFKVKGIEYYMEPDQGDVLRHSGKYTYSELLFDTEILQDEEKTQVRFSLFREKEEGVFPSSINLRVTYTVYENRSSLYMLLEVDLEEDAPLNIINHSYFNLGGKEDILDASLQINASRVSVYNEKLIPVSSQLVDARLDFRKGMPLVDHIEDPSFLAGPLQGYDHCFPLDKKEGSPDLLLTQGEYRLAIFTTCPAIVVYTDNYPHQDFFFSSGRKEKKYSCIAIEPAQILHDFSSWIKKGGETYSYQTEYCFSKIA